MCQITIVTETLIYSHTCFPIVQNIIICPLSINSQCNLKKIVGSNNFTAQFIEIISQYKTIGYNINVLQQTACLVVNPITVGNFAFLFNCTPVGQ